jgi:outer membrane protein TolC
MKKTIFLVLLTFPVLIFAQSRIINLDEAIKIAQKNSPDYKRTLNMNQRSYWRFNNFKARYLPQFKLQATLPEFQNSTRRIINNQGEDIFVKSNQSVITGGLSISQSVPYTGGYLSINSELEKINIYGNNPSSGYSVVPFSIRYFQNSLFYNSFRWDKKIEPLYFEESKKDFVEKMEDISRNTCLFYFGLLRAQSQLKISKTNLSNQDTLFDIAKGRFKMGRIAENDVLQMELALLKTQNSVTTNEIALKKTSQDFARYLELDTEDLELEVPRNLAMFNVTVEKALEEAQSNRKSVIEFRRRRLEAEKELARVKGTNKIELSARANFGIDNRGEVFDDLFQNFDKREYFSLSVGIPIFDWGVSKSERKMAEADLDLVKNDIEQEKQAFEQEIFLHTLNWSNQRDFLATAEKAKEIAIKRYDITKKRYIIGKITITDLNLAQQEMDKAVFDYLNSLEKFWVDYYTLRRLTLYDFIENKKLAVEDILYE